MRADGGTGTATGASSTIAWLCVAVTVALTVYGQIVIKWQVTSRGHVPASLSGKVDYFARLLTTPWVLSALAGAVIAALCWMAALSRLPLSQAYPFVGLSFAFVLILSAVFLGEPLTVAKVGGIALIIVGITVASTL
jgi:drug/metabolite transporter (DMT)-like permease